MSIFYIIFGIFVGFASGFFGIGGGIIIVPAMILIGFNMKEAVGISILPMLFSSVFGSFVNVKNKMLELKGAIILGLGGFTGALASAYIIKSLSEIVLLGILITIQLFNVLKMARLNLETGKKPIESMPLLFLLGLVVGLISISVGVGGSILILPALLVFFHYDIKKAVSTGLFFVVFSSSSGFISLAINNMVNYSVGLLIAFGALVGVYFGVRVAKSINKNAQKIFLIIFAIAILFVLVQKLVAFF